MQMKSAYICLLLVLQLAAGAASATVDMPDDANCLIQTPTTKVTKRGAKKKAETPPAKKTDQPSASTRDNVGQKTESPGSSSSWIVDAVGSLSAMPFFEIIVIFSVASHAIVMTQRTTSPKNMLKQYGPEMLGIIALVAVALILQMHGSMMTVGSAAEEKVLRKMMSSWPTLLTGDSLLGLQAMLRFLVLISGVARRREGPTLLAKGVAALFCAAALGRTVLLARSKVYMLDGPLGGSLPAALDALSVPILAVLARGMQKRTLLASALALVAAAIIASENFVNIADADAVSNALFVFVHTTELFAAFACLFRYAQRNVALDFGHIMMQIQQCLAAYYFLEILVKFPHMVGAGYPFEILRVGAVAQVLFFAVASILHFTQLGGAQKMGKSFAEEELIAKVEPPRPMAPNLL